jgi:hypothetical protein
VKTHWRRGTKRILVGLLQLGLAAFLICASTYYDVLEGPLAVVVILLITSGGVSYFSGCLARAKARGVAQSGVLALPTLCGLCIPLSVIFVPFGFVFVLPLILMPFLGILAISLAPLVGWFRPGKIRRQDLGWKQPTFRPRHH